MHNSLKSDHCSTSPLVAKSPDAHRRARGSAEGPLHVEGRRELAGLGFGLDQEDACDVLEKLTAEDSAGRLKSDPTGE